MNALRRMVEAVRPGGLVLDLQVIRPDPRVELNGRVVAEIDGEPLFAWADAATAAVDARIEAGDLVEEAVDDHDVCEHYSDGTELVEDFAGTNASFRGTSCRVFWPSRSPLSYESGAACGDCESDKTPARADAADIGATCHGSVRHRLREGALSVDSVCGRITGRRIAVGCGSVDAVADASEARPLARCSGGERCFHRLSE